MEGNPAKNIQESFSALTDPRVNRRKRHKLMDILIIAICAVICEAETWEDMAEFGRAKYK
jgi:predicted transposase YbfD/YdcC